MPVKISNLPAAGTITGAETLPLVQSSVTSRSLLSTLATWIGNNLAIDGMRLQFFTLRITNTGGTFQHRISSGGAAGNRISKITAASATLQNTPTGADASTAFAYGGKISTVAPSVFIFDTATQVIADQANQTALVFNSSGVALLASFSVVSYNVNGVTQNRLTMQLTNATSGAAYSISTLGAGLIIDVSFFGFLA